MEKETKGAFFQMRATTTEKAEWEEAAKADECDSVAQWFRKLARDRRKSLATKSKRQSG